MTSGPWLLTTVTLVILRVMAVRAGQPGIQTVEQVITVVYAMVLVLTAPVDVIVARFTSDLVYEGKPQRIAAPLLRTLAGVVLALCAAGAGAMAILEVPFDLAVAGTILSAVVAGQWLFLGAAGGLSSPGTVLRAFAVGAPLSIAASLFLSQTVLGAAGNLWGFCAGQVVTLASLLFGTLRALPSEEEPGARILPAFSRYWLLALAALFFHAGIWLDKIVVYFLDGGDIASRYAALAAIAWLSVIPTSAYLFVQVETRFYRRYQAYFGALEKGGTLDELEAAAAGIGREARRILLGAGGVQLSVTLVAILATPHVVTLLGLPDGGDSLRALLVGATLQVLALCATLLLYYLDLRKDALAVAAVQAAGSVALTYAADGLFPSGTGYAAACALALAVALVCLKARLGNLLRDTFQSQPYETTR